MTTQQHEYTVIEDNGGGLALFVFDSNGISGGKVIYAHTGYEYHPGTLVQDLDALGKGASVADWEGNEDDPQAIYDSYDDNPAGWEVVCQGYDNTRYLFEGRMGAAAQLEFGKGF